MHFIKNFQQQLFRQELSIIILKKDNNQHFNQKLSISLLTNIKNHTIPYFTSNMSRRPSTLPSSRRQQLPRRQQSQQNISSTINQQGQAQQPHIDLRDYTQLNQSGYYINYMRLLGKGRYGQVYQGYSRKHQLKMAVKKIPQATQNGTNIAFETKKQIDMLQQVCSDKNYHKNVMKYYHYEDAENFFFVFTQYCEKGSLKEYVTKKGSQISQKQYFRVLKSIVEGMIFINKKFIIHRDIKPANILVNEKDEIKIGDFGISRQIPLGDEAPTKNMCTPHYGAPQILRENQFYTENIDVWSCGVMMYELIEKKSIYDRYRPKTVNQLIKALKLFEEQGDFVQFSNPNISQKFQNILRKMLTIDYTKRPAFEQIQKYIQYEELVKFYHLYESPNADHLEGSEEQKKLLEYNEQQKEKYLTILKKYLKYKRDKLSMLLTLQKKFMNKPFQVLWNVEKFLLKYLTLNMFVIKSQEYSNWLHVSLNDNIINLEEQLKIKISEYRYNYRVVAQLLREEKKRVDIDIRKYYKNILTQQEKIQIDYLNRQKEAQRIRSYMDVRVIEELFAYTHKNQFAPFDNYHTLYKSLIQLKQYYLTYQHVEALPTFQDKEIYFSMLFVYRYDKFFNQSKYVKELLMEEEMNNTPGEKHLKLKKDKDQHKENNFILSKHLQTSITGCLTQSVSDFKQRMEDEKQMMKWIRRYNLCRIQVFGKDNKNSDKETQSYKFAPTSSKVKSVNQKVSSSKSVNSKSFNKEADEQKQEPPPPGQILPSERKPLVEE